MLFYSALKYGFISLSSVIILAAIYLFISVIISPLLKIRFYKKQGLKTYFYPFLGSRKRMAAYHKKFDDSQAYLRQLSHEDPNIRAEASNLGPRINVTLYDTKLVKEFYNKPLSTYAKIQPTVLKKIFGDGILFAEGAKWKGHRKIISNVFHFEFLKSNIPLVVSTAQEFLGELKDNTSKPIDVINEIQKITGEVVGRTFFGQKLNNHIIRGKPLTLYLADLLQRSQDGFKNPVFWLFLVTKMNIEWIPSLHRYMNEVREFRAFIHKIIQDYKKSERKDAAMLGLLLATQDAAKEDERFTDDDLLDEFMTFFIAGMDTTANTVNMALYLLKKHPEDLERVKKEVKEIYSRNNPVTTDVLNQMEFTHAVIKETLRLYTPAPGIVPRVAQVDHEIGDLKIKKGSSVSVGFIFNSSHEKNFESSEQFMPERWLKKGDIDPFAYTPFSAGPRNCIGQHLAIIEAKVIIAEFVKTFEFKVVPEDYKLVMGGGGFLYGPKNPIHFDISLAQ